MDTWDIALLVVAGFVAVLALVRLMSRRRNQLVEELLDQARRHEGSGRKGRLSDAERRPPPGKAA